MRNSFDQQNEAGRQKCSLCAFCSIHTLAELGAYRGSTAEGYACADTLAQIKFFANLWVSIVGRDWTEYDEEDEDMAICIL